MARKVALIDTTLRDAHESLVGGRIYPDDLIEIAKHLDNLGYYAVEGSGGATFEIQVRELKVNPWEHIKKLRQELKLTKLLMLVRGQNLVGHKNYADDVVEAFVASAAGAGVDVFRVFDPLNDIRNMEAVVKAAKKRGKKVQGALCYTVSPVHTLDLWAKLAKALVKLGCDEITIKDTGSLLGPQNASELVSALKSAVKVPVGVHSHCGSGLAPIAYMAAVEAGANILDVAISPLAWGASQPAAESICAALSSKNYDLGIDIAKLYEVKDIVQGIRTKYMEYLSPLADRVEADVLKYQIPATMLQDIYRELNQQDALGRLKDVLAEVKRVREDMGYPPLVSPIRQIVARQSIANVLSGERYRHVIQDFKDYLHGLYGAPPVPADAALRRQILGREEPITCRPADLIDPQMDAARKSLGRLISKPSDEQVLLYHLFGEEALDVLLLKKAEAISEVKIEQNEVEETSEVEEHATSVDTQELSEPEQVMEFEVEVDGDIFTVRVKSKQGVVQTTEVVSTISEAIVDGAIKAPMQGVIVKVSVNENDRVNMGQVVAVLEAMKMQNDIVSDRSGVVKRVLVRPGDSVAPGSPIVIIE